MKNPQYQMINVDPNIVPEADKIYSIEEIRMINENMINVYEKAF